MEGKSKEKKNRKTAIEAAYSYLGSRMRTTEELRSYLRSKAYGENEIKEAVRELTDMRYLDDYSFAVRYYEYNREKKRGTKRAERELAEKGVDREIIANAKEDYLFENNVDEYEDALAIARKDVFVTSDIYGGEAEGAELDDKLSAKIARRLEAKGFTKGDIFKVLDALRREAAENRE